MSEARELFEALADQLKKLAHLHVTKGNRDVAAALSNTRNAIAEALATQPEPGAVPELPAHMVGPDHRGDYWMTMPDGTRHLIRSVPGYDGYAARMAEAWSAIAARERARRAGS